MARLLDDLVKSMNEEQAKKNTENIEPIEPVEPVEPVKKTERIFDPDFCYNNRFPKHPPRREPDPVPEVEPVKKKKTKEKTDKQRKNSAINHFRSFNNLNDNVHREKNLSGSQCIICYCLLRHAKNGEVTIGYELIKKDTCLSKNRISKNIQQLIEKEVIKRTKKGNPGGNGYKQILSVYRLLF
jgi:hypothetical protein